MMGEGPSLVKLQMSQMSPGYKLTGCKERQRHKRTSSMLLIWTLSLEREGSVIKSVFSMLPLVIRVSTCSE